MKSIFLFIPLVFVQGAVLAQETNKTELTLDVFERKLRQSPSPQILDVRTPEEFAENHLAGAVNFSLQNDTSFVKAILRFNKQKPVFVYSINNGRSTVVSEKLREAGFTEVYSLPGGLAHWIGTGKPIIATTGNGLSIEDYNKLVASEHMVLVNVGSKYCGGCRKLVPIVDEIKKEQGSSLKVVKVELYDSRMLADSLNIESVPTLILYKGGSPIWKKSGTITKIEIQGVLDGAL